MPLPVWKERIVLLELSSFTQRGGFPTTENTVTHCLRGFFDHEQREQIVLFRGFQNLIHQIMRRYAIINKVKRTSFRFVLIPDKLSGVRLLI